MKQIIFLFFLTVIIAIASSCNEIKNAEIKNADGYLIETFEFIEDSIKHGAFKSYYQSTDTTIQHPILKQVGQYQQNQKHGNWQDFNEHGKLIEAYTFAKGKKTGPAKLFYINGLKKADGRYINGQKIGKWKFYHLDGTISHVGSMEGETKIGQWKFYRKGQLEGVVNFGLEGTKKEIKWQDLKQIGYTTIARDNSGKRIEAMPEFPGGQKSMLDFIFSNLHYPKEAQQNNISGLTVISFVIDEMGQVRDAEIQRDIGGGCGQEALRMINDFPRFLPGIQRGKPIKVDYSLPVRFEL